MNSKMYSTLKFTSCNHGPQRSMSCFDICVSKMLLTAGRAIFINDKALQTTLYSNVARHKSAWTEMLQGRDPTAQSPTPSTQVFPGHRPTTPSLLKPVCIVLECISLCHHLLTINYICTCVLSLLLPPQPLGDTYAASVTITDTFHFHRFFSRFGVYLQIMIWIHCNYRGQTRLWMDDEMLQMMDKINRGFTYHNVTDGTHIPISTLWTR